MTMDRRVNLLMWAAFLVLFIYPFPLAEPRKIDGMKAREMPTESIDQMNHIQLVQSWTPTACGPGGYTCIKPLPMYYTNNFSMNGLWPARADGKTLPQPENPKPVPDDLFKSIEAQMNTYWANINAKSTSHSFWAHEWVRHGAAGNWGEDGARNYFLDGIKARQNIDLLSILKAGGIVFNTNYTKPEIIGAISKRLAVKNLYISCWRVPGSSSYHLLEILLCLDKQSHSYISCPVDNDLRNCLGENFQIPHV